MSRKSPPRLGRFLKSKPLVIAEPLERRRLLTAISWTAQGDGINWTDPNNWSTGGLPHVADDVTINTTGSRIQLTSGAQSIRSLTTNTPIDVSGGSLTVS